MKQRMMFLALALLLLSCKENSSTEPVLQTETVKDYFPMTKGSYWLYKVYEADTSFVFTDTGHTDSIAVAGDTIINGHTYTLFQSSMFGVTAYRDSAGCIITNDGEKILSLNPNLSFIEDRYLFPNNSTYYLTSSLVSKDSSFNVPAGSFTAKYIRGTVTNTKTQQQWEKQRVYTLAFAKNIGLVYRQVFYVGSPIYLEFRLLRYSVRPTISS